MRAFVLAASAAASLAFLALAASPWLDGTPAAPPPRAATPAADPALVFAPPDERRTDFAALIERPLFSAVRRPPPPEAPGTPIVDPGAGLVLGLYEIAGVVMGAGGPVAMLRDEAGRMIRVRVGDRIEARRGEAEVSAITLDALTFRRGGDTVVAPVRGEEGRAEGTTTE
ncbi:MAG: hypothetical protein AAGF90_18600 [Pseudomonadota bacterium]